MMNKALSERSRGSLENQMWDGLIPAIFSCSGGLILMIASVFWRFALVEPRLVIRYSSDDAVWSSALFESLVHAPTRPEIPIWPTFLMAMLVLLGATIWYVGGKRWRDAHGELRRRRLGGLHD